MDIGRAPWDRRPRDHTRHAVYPTRVNSVLYLAGAFAYGLVKSLALGATSSSFPLFENTAGVLEEELVYRLALERGLGRKVLGLRPMTARVGQAVAFGFIDHPWNPVESAAGAVVYSYAYDEGGFPLAVGTHLAHNLAVYLGGLK